MSERFEKFTHAARLALTRAQEEAQRRHQDFIGTEHILLGLIRDSTSVAARILNDTGVQLGQIYSAVEALIENGSSTSQPGEIGLTPQAKRVLDLSFEEARIMKYDYIESEHILLGLIREGEGIAAEVLSSFGVELEATRQRVKQAIEGSAELSGERARVEIEEKRDLRAARFGTFTERARLVLTRAQEEAQHFNHNYIGTEHLLLALTRDETSLAARVLNDMGVELRKIRSNVEFIIGRGDRAVMDEIGLTPRSKRVIELAVDEARRLNHSIGTEHLLLGLVREGEGIAAGALESMNVSLEMVRLRVRQALEDAGK